MTPRQVLLATSDVIAGLQALQKVVGARSIVPSCVTSLVSSKAESALLSQLPSDPLEIFRRHRLGMCKQGSLSFLSTTFANKINPNVPFCPFALVGKCNDASCKLQHIDAVALNEEELLLVCFNDF